MCKGKSRLLEKKQQNKVFFYDKILFSKRKYNHNAFLSTKWHAARRTIERGKTSQAKICLKTSMKDV